MVFSGRFRWPARRPASRALCGAAPRAPAPARPARAASAVSLTCARAVLPARARKRREPPFFGSSERHLAAFHVLMLSTLMLQKSLVFHQRGGHFFQKVQKELCVKIYGTGPVTNGVMIGSLQFGTGAWTLMGVTWSAGDRTSAPTGGRPWGLCRPLDRAGSEGAGPQLVGHD